MAIKAPPSPDVPVSGKFRSAMDERAVRRGAEVDVGAAVGVGAAVDEGAAAAEATVVGVGRAVVVVVGRAGPDF
jgi:hypothetical protein